MGFGPVLQPRAEARGVRGQSWLCQEQAMCSWSLVSSSVKWQSFSPCPSQSFMEHAHNTRCVKQELMQGGFVGDKREKLIIRNSINISL